MKTFSEILKEFEKDLIKYEIINKDNNIIFRLPEFKIDIVNLEQKTKKIYLKKYNV